MQKVDVIVARFSTSSEEDACDFLVLFSWNEWVSLPVKFCDLPRDAVLCLSVYDCHGPRQRSLVGGAAISLYGRYGQLREGIHDLKVWPKLEPISVSEFSKGDSVSCDGNEEMRRLSKARTCLFIVSTILSFFSIRIGWFPNSFPILHLLRTS